MKKIITLGTLSLVASALLIGCGSSSSSKISGETYKTGYFIDAPVANADYVTTSGKKGRTDSNGKFEYKDGDKVKFSIGKLSLGEATPAADGLITPRNLGSTEEQTVMLLRVLQALDSDNNSSNGITISDTVISSLEKIAQDIDISSLQNDADIIGLDSSLGYVLDEDYDNIIDVNDQDAQAHFEDSLEQWDKGTWQNNSHIDEDDNNGHGLSSGDDHVNQFDLSIYPVSTLSLELKESLAYMGNEERLAYDIYTTLYNYHADNGDEIQQLTNISSRSESTHVGIVQDLVKRYNIDISELSLVQNPVADKNVEFESMPMGHYDIPAIQDLYNVLYEKGIASTQAALEVGCMVEVVDVTDLDKYIGFAETAGATDVVEAFNVLRDGSYNHYWAFDKGLKNMGITEGCGVLGQEYIKDYPQNEHGGDGQGNRR
jgi:hypothetical protein